MTVLHARFATAEECRTWNERVAANPGGGEIWMSDQYLEQKRHGGYTPHRVIVELPADSGAEGPLQVAVGVLSKKVVGLGSWWHLPAGPDGRSDTETLRVAQAVGTLARSRGAFFLKVEPRLGTSAQHLFTDAGFIKTFRIVPNESTVVMPLASNPEEVLASFPKKTRYAIRKAERDGVRVERVATTEEHCAQFYALLQETGEGRFLVRSEDYYRTYWQRFQQAGVGQLFFAYQGDELLAGAFVMVLGARATYKDGASSRSSSAYGSSHAIQWEAMQWAVEQGATAYDFCGAPPSDRIADTTHPLHGVGQFKLSFFPEVTDYVGAYDLPLKPSQYRIWSAIGDRIARRASLLVKRDPYY